MQFLVTQRGELLTCLEIDFRKLLASRCKRCIDVMCLIDAISRLMVLAAGNGIVFQNSRCSACSRSDRQSVWGAMAASYAGWLVNGFLKKVRSLAAKTIISRVLETRCKRCKRCKGCKPEFSQISLQNQRQVALKATLLT